MQTLKSHTFLLHAASQLESFMNMQDNMQQKPDLKT